MKYRNEILNKSYTNTVDKLNKIKGLENKFIYRYDSKNNWYDIIHSINNELQTNDQIAKIVSDILYEELLNKDIFNFSFYEDKNIISESTLEFTFNTKKVISDRYIVSNSKFNMSNFKSKTTKKLRRDEVKIA
ncbi:hypothetical protein SHJJP8905_002388 [Staphylococcus lugdunensis]|uniref:hypothetical protein n=1 Tax=Staphylococcus TaxID=1279 RepID=UPI0011AB51DA|nr:MULTISPECIES: hypothetical protein [Staphylococcus]MCH4327285.1 hypothetical protein [Staphylococcus haemolyticus]MCH8659919.1 hypothetical protein [Staphylococcus lugdunensis]MCH8669432.1 hypothetical protein [Staphylococcus lugdunensis]